MCLSAWNIAAAKKQYHFCMLCTCILLCQYVLNALYVLLYSQKDKMTIKLKFVWFRSIKLEWMSEREKEKEYICVNGSTKKPIQLINIRLDIVVCADNEMNIIYLSLLFCEMKLIGNQTKKRISPFLCHFILLFYFFFCFSLAKKDMRFFTQIRVNNNVYLFALMVGI